jgi:glucose-fructose oxidoreductase
VSSFNAADLSEYRIVGTRGHLRVEPAYDYAEELEYTLTVNGKRKRKRISRRDHFAAELLYFSDCILKGRRPEPSGEEGMQDVRIIQAIFESADAGKAVTIPPFKDPASGPTRRQRISRPPVRKPRLVKVRSASGDN